MGLRIGLQFFGGRGASSGGVAGGIGGGSGGVRPTDTTSLISAREGYRSEVDQVLEVMRQFSNRYGLQITDAQIAMLPPSQAGVMAYYDNRGNMAINALYFNTAQMDATYDDCVTSGWHPSRGDRTGLEATSAHELGHAITEEAGRRAGYGDWAIDRVSSEVVNKARQQLGLKTQGEVGKAISGYGAQNNAECIAEAVSDVWCNGANASNASKVVFNVLDSYFN